MNYYFNQLLFCKYYCEYLITYWNVKVNMYGGKYWKRLVFTDIQNID